LLRGRTTPGKITLTRPDATFRLDRSGKFLNLPEPPRRAGGSGPLPDIDVEEARVAIRQEGRPEMAVEGVAAFLRNREGKAVVSAAADDPTWGRVNASGTMEPDVSRGRIRLATGEISADPAKLQ